MATPRTPPLCSQTVGSPHQPISTLPNPAARNTATAPNASTRLEGPARGPAALARTMSCATRAAWGEVLAGSTVAWRVAVVWAAAAGAPPGLGTGVDVGAATPSGAGSVALGEGTAACCSVAQASGGLGADGSAKGSLGAKVSSGRSDAATPVAPGPGRCCGPRVSVGNARADESGLVGGWTSVAAAAALSLLARFKASSSRLMVNSARRSWQRSRRGRAGAWHPLSWAE